MLARLGEHLAPLQGVGDYRAIALKEIRAEGHAAALDPAQPRGGHVPGAGATIASFVSYGVESQFGRRRPHGLRRAGASSRHLVRGHRLGGRGADPLLALGIPGGATAAILGAFMLHGVQPSPQVMMTSPAMVYTIFASLFVGIVFMARARLLRHPAAGEDAGLPGGRGLVLRHGVLLHRRAVDPLQRRDLRG